MNPNAKIDRPPTAENWVRMQHPELEKTAKAVFNFLRGMPTWNYNLGRAAIAARIEDRIPRSMVEAIVDRSKSAIGRPFNRELINAFLDYEEKHPIDGVKAFDQFSEFFPLSRSVRIPIKPLTVVRENGRFNPVFLVPWSRVSFDPYQASLLMTLLEEAVFTHTDFENSEGKILFFPKSVGLDGSVSRRPMIWRRGQFPLLDRVELEEQIKVFFEGKRLAGILYQDFLARKKKP